MEETLTFLQDDPNNIYQRRIDALHYEDSIIRIHEYRIHEYSEKWKHYT